MYTAEVGSFEVILNLVAAGAILDTKDKMGEISNRLGERMRAINRFRLVLYLKKGGRDV